MSSTSGPPGQREPADYDSQSERTPPQDPAAERSVLGGMLLSKDAIADVTEILEPADFYQPANAAIFETVMDLYGRGEPADPITVAAALQSAGSLSRVGGANFLHTLISEVPTAANASWYARTVAGTALRRRAIEACLRGVQYGYGPGDPADIVDRIQQAVYDISNRRASEDYVSFDDLIRPAYDLIEQNGDPSAGETKVPTGFKDLDQLLGGGLNPGQLAVVAGRPSMGKSTLAVDLARAASFRNHRRRNGPPAPFTSAIFSLEMNKLELMMRLISAEARVPLNLLRSGQLADTDWTQMVRRMADLEGAPLLIDDTPNITLMEIRAKARRMKQHNDLKLVVVDYLQLMSSPKRTENREQEVADLSRGLKLLAMEIECPVIAVSQLNRGPEGRPDKRPLMSDLRNSGAIEQDADLVIFVHRDDYYDKESPRAGEADFIVAKHRNGPTDTITVAAQLHFSRFVDMAIN